MRVAQALLKTSGSCCHTAWLYSYAPSRVPLVPLLTTVPRIVTRSALQWQRRLLRSAEISQEEWNGIKESQRESAWGRAVCGPRAGGCPRAGECYYPMVWVVSIGSFYRFASLLALFQEASPVHWCMVWVEPGCPVRHIESELFRLRKRKLWPQTLEAFLGRLAVETGLGDLPALRFHGRGGGWC